MLHAKMQKEVGTVHYKRSVFRSFAMVTQLGFSVLTPILLCVYTGYLVDSHFGTKLMVPMLILGVLAGGRCGWVMARNTLLQEQKEDERLRQQQSAGQGRSGISKPKQPSRILRESSQTETGTAGRSGSMHAETGSMQNMETDAGQTVKEADHNGMAE